MAEAIDIEISPFELAVDRLEGRIPVASRLRTADWDQVPAAIRERAQFSAAVDDLRTMQGVQDKLVEWAELGRRDPDRAFMDRSKFVAEMRQEMGAAEGDPGSLTDIASRRRLELIYDFQTQDAMEFGRWKMSQDPEVLSSFPAQELVRIEERRDKRNWVERWRGAGGRVFPGGTDPDFGGGRLVALKTDPVWTRISRFGKPWPPFDFGSGMGVEDVGVDEAVELGLLAGEDQAGIGGSHSSPLQGFAETEFSAEGMDGDLVGELVRAFAGKLALEGGMLRWLS